MASPLVALLDEFGDVFADHHGGDVGVGPDAVGHDGAIDHPEALDAVDLGVLVDNGHGVGGRPILQVPDMWWLVLQLALMKASKASSVARSASAGLTRSSIKSASAGFSANRSISRTPSRIRLRSNSSAK